MSDQSGKRGGALLRGADGRVQSRKPAAWICFLLGVGLLVQGSFLPAVVALLFSLLFWGLLIMAIERLKKGLLYLAALLAVSFGID